MFSYRNDRLETKAKEPMGPNRNKSRATWQTWQFLATGPLSLSIQQCLVKGPGDLLCFGVEERPDRSEGSGIGIRTGALNGARWVLLGLGCARVLPGTTDRALGYCGVAAADGSLYLLLDLLGM